jgi:GAF domain-containing protein
MLKSLQQTLSAPVFEDVEKTRVAVLLNSILWAVIAIGGAYTITAPFFLGQSFSALLTGTIVIVGVIARQLMIRGFVRGAAIILLIVFNLILTLSIFVSNGTLGASYTSLVLTAVMGGVLLGGRGGFIMAGINSMIGLAILLAQDSLPATLIPQSPITFFSSLLVYLFFIASLLRASANGFDQLLENLRRIQQELTSKNQEMQQFAQQLETTIADRTAELNMANKRNERRARQFEVIAKISRVINQAQNLNTLLPQITELISEQFDYYHTGIFLLDQNKEFAVLFSANSLGGQRMLARNHKLRIGQTGIVGYVAGTGLPRIALDIGADAIYFNNPDLPDTRSELALPLFRKGEEVIGVLDVQSLEQNAFSQEDVRTLSTLADQVSIAIENSRLFEDQERLLLETRAVSNRDLSEGWVRFTRSQNIVGIQRRSLKNNILPEPLELPGETEATRSGNIYKRIENDGSATVTIPIKLREQIVGVLNVKSENKQTWGDDDLDVVSAIVERAALAIENARLLEESRLIAEREHVISEISAKISTGTQIEDILKTAIQELGSHISGSQVSVEIGDGEA